MKSKIYFSALMMMFSLTSFGQKGIEAINGFKYAYVNMLTYENNRYDIFGITNFLRNELTKKGFIVLDYNRNTWSQEAKLNPCLIGTWIPSHSGGGIPNSANGGFIIKNCKGEIVYENSTLASHFGYYYDKNAPYAVEKAFKPIRDFDYKFTESLTPKIDYPEVETTEETEESIKKYLTSNKLDPIEGIYKSYKSNGLSYYKIGIIKANDKYKAIIIECDLPQWKRGEVKAIFEHSSMKGLYSTEWYRGDKKSYETFANMDNEAILTIEFENKNGEKTQDKFIKMFPPATGDITYKKDNSKASGSGFFLSSTGVVATNAHVIANASKIEIVISNEIGTFTYKTKILLSDNKNDVALLQIDDSTFKGLSSIPYGLSEKGEVGEKVFTIGYPLNDVMGTNYKLTDGIISSKSGIEDDVRYYQISVPLQPGNSGGPLFNKDGIVIGITSSKLNSKAVGTDIQNVNYAIKASYLLNLYNMLPNPSKIETTSQVANKQLQDQVKVLKNYVCLIKVY